MGPERLSRHGVASTTLRKRIVCVESPPRTAKAQAGREKLREKIREHSRCPYEGGLHELTWGSGGPLPKPGSTRWAFGRQSRECSMANRRFLCYSTPRDRSQARIALLVHVARVGPIGPTLELGRPSGSTSGWFGPPPCSREAFLRKFREGEPPPP